MPPHRINRLLFDLHFAEETLAFRTRHRIERCLQEEIFPVLERTLDRHGPGDRVRRIDCLEVELGNWNPAAPGTSLQDLIGRALGEQLQALSRVPSDEISDLAGLVEALAEFLQGGIWSWRIPFSDLSELEKAVLQLPPKAASQLVERLRPLLCQAAPALRLAHQFTGSLRDWFLVRLHPAAPERIASIGEGSTTGGSSGDPTAGWIQAAAGTPRNAPASQLDEQFGRLFDSAPPATVEIETAGEPPPAPSRQVPADSTADGLSGVPSRDRIFIHNAGVVLLHPFLQTLFEALRLVDASRRFPSRHSQLLAIQLLHFLVCGEERPAEIATPLYKILCGWPLKAPQIPVRSLTRREKGEARRLLRSAIEHWTRLGKTSIEGLREAFLQREGSLSRQSEGWQLTVETRSIDILLGSLPWSLSVVRLPWMEARLAVDWS